MVMVVSTRIKVYSSIISIITSHLNHTGLYMSQYKPMLKCVCHSQYNSSYFLPQESPQSVQQQLFPATGIPSVSTTAVISCHRNPLSQYNSSYFLPQESPQSVQQQLFPATGIPSVSTTAVISCHRNPLSQYNSSYFLPQESPQSIVVPDW